MALSRQKKTELIDLYKEGLATAPHAFLLNFQGITVPQVTELRAKIREGGGQYMVVKNSLALRAIEGGPLENLKELFDGPVAVAYTHDSVVNLAKALTEGAKDVPTLRVTGGLVDSQPVDVAQVEEIASLPTREELIAKLLFLLQSPITRFARVLAAVPRDFVMVLEQVRQEKEKASS